VGHTERLIRETEQSYGIRVKKVQVIRDVKRSSLVAKLVTDDGTAYVLKTLYVSTERQQFIAHSERLLVRKGIPLAKPVPTRSGELCMTHEGESYVLYEWVDGKAGKLRNIDDLLKIVRAMAHFHKASRNLKYPDGVKLYNHPHWQQEYNERIQSIRRWQNETYDPMKEGDAVIGKSIPFFVKMGKRARKLLLRSEYSAYMDQQEKERTLVHGDLHHKNVIFQNGKAIMIDFEDVRYDVPSKDLIRIYSMYSRKHGFSKKDFLRMMRAYEEINKLTPEEKQLIYIDFLFPHIFERMLRKKKYTEVTPAELEQWIRQEEKKAQYVYDQYFKEADG